MQKPRERCPGLRRRSQGSPYRPEREGCTLWDGVDLLEQKTPKEEKPFPISCRFFSDGVTPGSQAISRQRLGQRMPAVRSNPFASSTPNKEADRSRSVGLPLSLLGGADFQWARNPPAPIHPGRDQAFLASASAGAPPFSYCARPYKDYRRCSRVTVRSYSWGGLPDARNPATRGGREPGSPAG